MPPPSFPFLPILLLTLIASCTPDNVGQSEITRWQDGKQAAVSLTYDDSTINQFRVALPIMNELDFPGTFYVVTGAIPGSEFKPRFVGRPVNEIINETAGVPTNSKNFFERASAVRFLGYDGTYRYHNQAGQLYESGRVEEAYGVIDEAYRRVRNGEFGPDDGYHDELYDVLAIEDMDVDQITWEELGTFARQGHEIGSHTILHPWLAVLDSANIHYELVKSREDIRNHLGPAHTFSAEAPFGTEDERVMEYALELYPALRNRMPHSWLEELNRSSKIDPGTPDLPYVQWQRGALSDTPMDLMKSWIDTSLEHGNVWLVLVFHGVEGIGWEPLTEAELREYFSYIDDRRNDLWVATFKDVTRYIRERMNAEIEGNYSDNRIRVKLTHSLDRDLYSYPLTLRTYVPGGWDAVTITIRNGNEGNNREITTNVKRDENGSYVQYRAVPNGGTIEIAPN